MAQKSKNNAGVNASASPSHAKASSPEQSSHNAADSTLENNAGVNASASPSHAKAVPPQQSSPSIAEAITPLPHQHAPPHLYLDDTWYIITAATYQQSPYLVSDQAKILIRDQLKEHIQEFKIKLKAWVILNNHYHLLLKSRNGYSLPRFLQRLHGSTSFTINGWEGKRGRKIWYNYWDTCIRDEHGFWTRFNYIHNNPIKHGCVANLSNWPYSSYHYYLRTQGEDWLADVSRTYPVLDYLEGDDF